MLRLLLFAVAVVTATAAEPGTTRVARWQDDKKAAFLLMFDDSWPSHWQVAVPELVKRGMIATFYINPGKGEYQKFKDKWETELWKQGMVYGNHTLTHKGAQNFDDADREISECNRLILASVPGKTPRLISYGQPGVKTWNVTPAQMQQLFDKYHLIDRLEFKNHGAVYHWKTTAEMLALADKAIATNGLEYLIVHGVERIDPKWSYQDFWALKQDIFLPLLDGLKERRDKGDLWITDHISAHQYERERDTATVKVLEASERRIRLELTCKADPQFYDFPLTLLTQVPSRWQQCQVTQGTNRTVCSAVNGVLRYPAQPDGQPMIIQPQ